MTSIGEALDREWNTHPYPPAQEDTMAIPPIIVTIETDFRAATGQDLDPAVRDVLAAHLTPVNMLAHVAAYLGALRDNPVVAAVEAHDLSPAVADVVAGWVDDAARLAKGAPAQPA